MAIRLVVPMMFALAVVALATCSESPPLDPEPTAQDAGASTPRIALHSKHDGNWNIYVMNPDGSGQTRLTNNPAADSWPSWSPDGRRITFISSRDDPDPNDDDRIVDIYVMNADGSGQTRLTNSSAWHSLPRWSPDGHRIAFQSYRDENWEIYVMNADGSGLTRLTDNSAVDGRPSWSPDAQRIAFYSTVDENAEIYVVNADALIRRTSPITPRMTGHLLGHLTVDALRSILTGTETLRFT